MASNLPEMIPDDVRAELHKRADELAADNRALIQEVSQNVVRMLKELEYLAFHPPKTRSGPQVQRGAIKDYVDLSRQIIEIARAKGLLKDEDEKSVVQKK